MYLGLTTEDFQNENHSWLGSARGTNSTRSGTLVLDSFTAGTHFPNGFLPSGLALGRFTSGPNFDAAVETFGPYTGGATNGLQTLAGFLYMSLRVPPGMTTGLIPGAVLDTGRVIVPRLPISIDATAQGTNVRFVYITATA
jgi:hypothetical protein